MYMYVYVYNKLVAASPGGGMSLRTHLPPYAQYSPSSHTCASQLPLQKKKPLGDLPPPPRTTPPLRIHISNITSTFRRVAPSRVKRSKTDSISRQTGRKS